MTRDEFQAAAGAVLDDAVTADDSHADPGWLDTLMRAADSYAATAAREAQEATEILWRRKLERARP